MNVMSFKTPPLFTEHNSTACHSQVGGSWNLTAWEFEHNLDVLYVCLTLDGRPPSMDDDIMFSS